MPTLKEQLQGRSTLAERTFNPKSAPDLSITIRRLKVSERNRLVARFGKTGDDLERGSGMSVAVIAAALVPPMTEEEVGELDAALADDIAEEINDFNGWTKKGRAELTDQFRPTT